MSSGIGRSVFACGVALASGLLLSACAGIPACSAVAYVYGGPAVIEFDAVLPTDTTVAACFGDGCEPAVVERADGRTWEVPQSHPFFAEDLMIPGEERSLRVVVAGADGAVSDGVHDIPVRTESTGVFGECPGPFTFEPVTRPAP